MDTGTVQSLPVLHVRAQNHYDAGFQIGSTFKGWIDEFIETADEMLKLRQFYSTLTGKEIYEEYLKSSSKYYPNTISEIRGMADGSGQSFADLFLLQTTSEITFFHLYTVCDTKLPANGTVNGCSDLLINSTSVRIIGHNDDWTDDVSNRTYLVHVTIYDLVPRGSGNDVIIREEFVSYTYPGSLPCFCFAMNKDLVVTFNSLMPENAVRKGIPVQILLRQLVICRTIEECAKVMKNEPVGCAYGMNINIAHINDSEMCSMEVYPKKTGTDVVVQRLPVLTSVDSESFLHHQNHYKYVKDFVEKVDVTSGSKRCEKTLSEFGDLKTEEDVKKVLGDTSDDLEPVFCRPSKLHIEANLKTSATAIFNITERRLDVYRSNPGQAALPCLTIPFLS